jgi:hypothetical protein
MDVIYVELNQNHANIQVTVSSNPTPMNESFVFEPGWREKLIKLFHCYNPDEVVIDYDQSDHKIIELVEELIKLSPGYRMETTTESK